MPKSSSHRAVRPSAGSIIAGVCAGLSSHFGIDVTLIRLAFLLLMLAKGLGLVVYGILWLLLPSEATADSGSSLRGTAKANLMHARLELASIRKRTSWAWRERYFGPWPQPLTRGWLALGAIVLGVVIVMTSLGFFDWLNGPRIAGLVLISIGLGAFLSLNQRAGR